MSVLAVPETIVRFIAKHPFLRDLRKLDQLPDLALVGGAVRDLLLERTHPDLDLCVAGDPVPVAKLLRKVFGGSYYVMDERFGVVRFITAAGQQVDLARRQGDNWLADLLQRDLTINTLAIPIFAGGQPVRELALLDPLNGCQDLAERRIRATSRTALEADPLRVLRIYRFAATLSFTIDAMTQSWANEVGPLLRAVAPERIRDEFCKTLAIPQASPYLRQLAGAGLLAIIIPEVTTWPNTGMPSMATPAEACPLLLLSNLDLLLARLRDWLPHEAGWLLEHLQTCLAGDRPLLALLRFAALSGAPVAANDSSANIGQITISQLTAASASLAWSKTFKQHKACQLGCSAGRRLRLANSELHWLGNLLGAWPLFEQLGTEYQRLNSCASGNPDSDSMNRRLERACYRFFRLAGVTAASAALLGLARHFTLLAPEFDENDPAVALCRYLLAEAAHPRITAARPPLLRGDRLRTELGLAAGPIVAVVLEAICEAQALGEVSNEQQALELAQRLLRSA